MAQGHQGRRHSVAWLKLATFATSGALELKAGDDIEIDVASHRQLNLSRKASASQLLARLRKYRGRLPIDFKFDRLEANERG